MIRQSDKLWRIILQPPRRPGLKRDQAAAFAPVGTVEMVFRTWEAIW